MENYTAPVLVELGQVRDVTAANSTPQVSDVPQGTITGPNQDGSF